MEELVIEAKAKMAKNDKKGTMERCFPVTSKSFDMYEDSDADGYSYLN
jgi:hypothetical protein